ncbi:threonine/serine exporter family protein [Bifidobacterium mongoliense]|uniref:threonine/serine ThrE exporter family protein n=1 Tax=Bifidobacterium mongoliense TaxID=518643 RepID=UPI002A751825|nr:threonine/serine exporter family protein [Bifidobacterium mongoliense]MDY3125937.1 threonine/serine exporter family protein [Bifidobacterium mongoliense]
MDESVEAVSQYHTHSIPLDMEDIERDWDKPVADAGIAGKASVIVRVGMLDLGSGTGSFRVREMMHRIAFPLGVHVRADVNLTDIEASCTDGKARVTEVVDLPSTGVNTERIWLLEHFADWFNIKLGESSVYHAKPAVSQELVEQLGNPTAGKSVLRAAAEAKARKASEAHEAHEAHTASLQTSVVPSPSQTTAPQSEGTQQDNPDGQSQLQGETRSAKTPRSERKPLGQYAEHFDHTGLRPDADHGHRGVTLGQVHARLDLIEQRKPLYQPLFSGFASGVACASFVFLLGGAPFDMLGAFFGAFIGHWVRRRLFAHHLNQFFVTFVSVAIAALVCTGTLRLIGMVDPVALQHDTAYIGAMLFVIPGFPLITGGLDMAKIDFPSGIQRLCYTMTIILMATFAGWMVAVIVHLNPQGFAPLGLNPWLNGALRCVAAFAGVWGFSVLFNSPQRMCMTAAFIGAITDTLRLTIVDFGVPAEAAAFIGALLSGLLASAWRSSVRRGLLPPYLGYPRICLTVPSIVIMVPGLYMYQAMFHLGQFDTLLALNWAFRAFMVIICLPIGLAMARVITDKSWRYDV